MADNRTSESRSALMARIGPKNTQPELAVRRLLHAMGYRFRLHRRNLPGTPDIVLPRHRTAIFVHGCYWHGHGCRQGRAPKSNTEYWTDKIAANRTRDARKRTALEAGGWRVVEIWQCELKDRDALAASLAAIAEAVPNTSQGE